MAFKLQRGGVLCFVSQGSTAEFGEKLLQNISLTGQARSISLRPRPTPCRSSLIINKKQRPAIGSICSFLWSAVGLLEYLTDTAGV